MLINTFLNYFPKNKENVKNQTNLTIKWLQYMADCWESFVLSSMSFDWFALIYFIWALSSAISYRFNESLMSQSWSYFYFNDNSNFYSKIFFSNYFPSFKSLLFCSDSCFKLFSSNYFSDLLWSYWSYFYILSNYLTCNFMDPTSSYKM